MDQRHKAWAMQWKAAAPRLQAIRDEELRELGSNDKLVSSFESNPEENGMVIFQKWMMRMAILEFQRNRDRVT